MPRDNYIGTWQRIMRERKLPASVNDQYESVSEDLTAESRALAAPEAPEGAALSTLADEKERELAQILADPMDFRSDVQVAKALGVGGDVLRGLKKNIPLMRVINQEIDRAFDNSRYAILKALLHNATVEKDTAAQKLCLELMGKLSDRSGEGVVLNQYFYNSSDEDIWSRCMRMQEDMALYEDEAREGARVFGPRGWAGGPGTSRNLGSTTGRDVGDLEEASV